MMYTTIFQAFLAFLFALGKQTRDPIGLWIFMSEERVRYKVPVRKLYGTGVCRIRAGQPPTEFLPPSGIFFSLTEKLLHARSTQRRKKICSCVLEGRLTTNLILSALHLQGRKCNVYVHFHLVSKSLIGISFRK